MAEKVQAKNADGDASGEADGYILIKVVNQVGLRMTYRIKPNAAMGKLMDLYSHSQQLSPDGLRFLFDGCRVLKTDTARKLEMENDDMIEVYQLQTGGGLGWKRSRDSSAAASLDGHWQYGVVFVTNY